MNIEIKHWNGRVLHTVESDSLKLALESLVLRDADLSDAVLSGAVLRGAVLRGAVLRDAVLRDADLSDAVLSGAVLRGAVLSGANLSGANLSGANLSGAVLRDADLRGAVLSGANLSGANLSGANLSGANLSGANLSGAEIPVVPQLHIKTLAAIEASQNPEGGLQMSSWHTCETTHCRAGWYITLAGEAGRKLEGEVGPAAAGALIALKSCLWMERVPNFYTSNEAALADIKACAERELSEAQ